LIFLDRDAKAQRKTPLFCPQVSNFGARVVSFQSAPTQMAG